MEQNPSCEAKRCWASQEILHILGNPNVRNQTHKILKTVLIPSHINPVPPSSSHFLKIHFLLPSGLPTKTVYATRLSPTRDRWRSHLILFDSATTRKNKKKKCCAPHRSCWMTHYKDYTSIMLCISYLYILYHLWNLLKILHFYIEF
jgi:hypothetical protein